MEITHGAPSFLLNNDVVRLHITRDGGMLAPAEFKIG